MLFSRGLTKHLWMPSLLMVLLLPAISLAINLDSEFFSFNAPEDEPQLSSLELLELLFLQGVISQEAYSDIKKILAPRQYYSVGPTGTIMVTFTPYNQMEYDEEVSYPGSPSDDRGFALRKASVGLKGWAFYRWLWFNLNVATKTDEDGNIVPGIENANMSAHLTPRTLKGTRFVPTHGITVGAMKIPFSRQNLTATEQLQFIDRSIVVNEMPISYDIGATLDADYNFRFDFVRVLIRAGVFNGKGDKDYTRDNNDNFMYVGRLRVDFLRPMRPGEGDLMPNAYPNPEVAIYPEPKGPKFSIGGSVLQNNDIDRVVTAWGVDAEFRWYGASLLGEYIATTFKPDLNQTLTDDQYADHWDTSGWHVQAGYYVKPLRLEPAVRYEEYELELVNQLYPERKLSATTFGLNFHLIGKHRAKVMANYVLRSELKGMPKLDNDSATVQFSLFF